MQKLKKLQTSKLRIILIKRGTKEVMKKKASINEYSKAIIAKAIKEKATFWARICLKRYR